MGCRSLASATLLAFAVVRSATAADRTVGPHASIQAAIDAALPGDTVQVLAGTYVGDLDFRGKAIRVVGRGPSSVLLGTGTGPVVRFTSSETADSVLDSFTVTGGASAAGGGILIENASPTVVRNVITGNRSSGIGSGIAIRGTNGAPPAPQIFNNLLTYNANLVGNGDPHTIQVVNATPLIVNNTIVEGDSNGILITGAVSAATLVMNNLIAHNGSAGQDRGRGICDFSGAVIQYNVFYRNTVAALLTRLGRNFRRVRTAEHAIDDPNLAFNSDRSPRFLDRQGGDFRLHAKSAAIHGGNPDPVFANLDGSRNTIGHSGGPLAAAGGC